MRFVQFTYKPGGKTNLGIQVRAKLDVIHLTVYVMNPLLSYDFMKLMISNS